MPSCRGLEHRPADQIVGQQASSEFFADHLRRLATQHVHAQRHLDGFDLPLVPSQSRFDEFRVFVALGCHLGGKRVPVDLVVKPVVADSDRIVLADLVVLEYT